jgi:hypothetical protein
VKRETQRRKVMNLHQRERNEGGLLNLRVAEVEGTAPTKECLNLKST